MSNQSLSRCLPRALTGALSLALLSAVSTSAQETAAPASDSAAAVTTTATPSLSLRQQLAAPLDLRVPRLDLSTDGSDSSSSSSTVASLEPVALGAAPAGADGNLQPPPYRRRRYGSPNYNDRWHNADGSNKLAFVAGGGFTVPTGSTGKRLNLNYSLKGGAGINFSRKLGALLEFNFDRFGLQGRELANQYNVYSSLNLVDSNNNPIDFSGLDASSYIWSFSLNPILTVAESQNSSAYVVFGGGFYHRVVNFTLPQVGQYCDPFYGCYYFQQNQTFDHYSNNTGGVNAGIGITHKFSRFSNERLFAEARYVYVFDAKDTNSQASLYPPANYSTSYIPVTVGIRF